MTGAPAFAWLERKESESMTNETALTMQALASVGGVIVGLLQCALIWAGLKQIRAAFEPRDRQMDAQSRALEAQSETLGGTGAWP